MNKIYAQYFDILWNQLRSSYQEQVCQQAAELEALQTKLRLLKSDHQALPVKRDHLKAELELKRQQLSQAEAELAYNQNHRQSLASEDLDHIKQECQRALKALQIERGLALLPEVKALYELSTDQPLKSFELELKERSGDIQTKWAQFLKTMLEKIEQLEQEQPQLRKSLKAEQERLLEALSERDLLEKACQEYGVTTNVLASILNLTPNRWQNAEQTLKAMQDDAETEAPLTYLSNQAYPPLE